MEIAKAVHNIISVIVTAALIHGLIQTCQATETTSLSAAGKALFQEKCAGCHTIGGGKLVGPDLKGVTAARDHKWLKRFIAAPGKVIASGDPIAEQLLKESGGVTMPDLGLSGSQVESLLAYLAQAGPQGGARPARAQPEHVAGDAAHGRQLFTGTVPLQKGGAPCISCHSISGIAPLGGGTLGPDLTGLSNRLGTGLASVLATLPFPTMKPIYQLRPLTPSEQADLEAMFSGVTTAQTVDETPLVSGLAVAVFVLLLLVGSMFWHKRLRGVWAPLLEASTGRSGFVLPAAPGGGEIPRRRFLKLLTIIFGSICTFSIVIPFIVSIIGPALRRKKTHWTKVGKVPALAVGHPVSMSYTGRTEDAYVREPVTRDIWVVKLSASKLAVYSPICPHLGCRYNWSASGNHFACPCHGSVFAIDGKVLGGPAPRPLDTLPAKVENGELLIQWEQFEPGISEKRSI